MNYEEYKQKIKDINREMAALSPRQRSELRKVVYEEFGREFQEPEGEKEASNNTAHMNRDKKNEHAGDALGYVSGGEGLPDGLTTFDSGATRSSDVDQFRYDLMSPIALGRVAVIFAEGAKVHGERNWEKGIPKSAMMNHAMAHLMEYVNGSTDEDHLAKAVWGFMGIMHFEGKDMEGY